MALKLYMDHYMPRAITMGMRLRHVDVVTAYEDQAHEIADPDLLDRATNLGRALFTQDDDLLSEATKLRSWSCRRSYRLRSSIISRRLRHCRGRWPGAFGVQAGEVLHQQPHP